MIFNWEYFDSLNREEKFEYLAEKARDFFGIKKKEYYTNKFLQHEKTKEYVENIIDNGIWETNRYSWNYYNGNEDAHVIDDYVYDSNLKSLEVLIDFADKYFGIYVESRFDKSPTFFIGGHDYPKGERKEYEHHPPMLSIKNARSIEELDNFLNQDYTCVFKCKKEKTTLHNSYETFIISPKVDGVACSITYYDGKISHAVTRGDGNKGLDITQHILEIKNIPKVINCQDKIFEVRGEIYMTKSSFDYVNETEKEKAEIEGKEFIPFSNPRNLVAGTLNNLNYKLAGERELQFIAHSAGYCYDFSINKLRWFLEKYKEYSFRVVDFVESKPQKIDYRYNSVKKSKFYPVDEIHELIDSMWNNVVKKLPYDCDGIVVAVNNRDIAYKLSSDKKYQAGSIACKYMLDTATRTRLTKIEYTVGKTGKVTPIAWFEPVEIAGSVVQKASLGSKETMEALDLHEDDIIQVSKAGGIIPHVDKAITESRLSNQKFVFPECCPVCGTKLECYGKKTYFCPACKQE